MSSLFRHPFDGTHHEALSYLHDAGSSMLSTPSPGVHATGAAALFGVGLWAGFGVAMHSVVAGVVVIGFAIALATADLLPALWTLSHREYAGRYLAARRSYGDGRVRTHPFLVLVAFPVLCFLAMAYAGPAGPPVAWGVVGALTGLALGLLRAWHAHRTIGRG